MSAIWNGRSLICDCLFSFSSHEPVVFAWLLKKPREGILICQIRVRGLLLVAFESNDLCVIRVTQTTTYFNDVSWNGPIKIQMQSYFKQRIKNIVSKHFLQDKTIHIDSLKYYSNKLKT